MEASPTHPPFPDSAVAEAFAGFSDGVRPQLLALRALIYDCAAGDPNVGRLQETLKWGQPAYLTPVTKSGSTIRLGQPKTGGYAVYVHCQTSLISAFQSSFARDFQFDGNRAVIFSEDEWPNENALRHLIRSALTYHRSV